MFRRLRLAIGLCVLVVALASAISLATTSDDEEFTDEDAAAVTMFSSLVDDEADDPKAQDSEAKSAARNVFTYVESCYASTGDYDRCDDDESLENAGASSDDLGDALVQVDGANVTVRVASKSTNEFVLTKTVGGALARTCTSTDEDGGCKGGRW